MTSSKTTMLPSNIKPIKYNITIAPDLDNFRFRGDISIDIQIIKQTDFITLNCIDLSIQSCKLSTTPKTHMDASKTTFDLQNETVTFYFSTPVPHGMSTIQIKFRGEINDKLRGFYRSKYNNPAGEECYLATTQFEATDARRAFPCWDEPGLKAKFQLTLLVPSNLTAISNTKLISEKTSNGVTRKEFAETPLMSTYLLAFIIGDLQPVEQKSKDGTLIRVWTTSGKESQGKFALDVSIKLLEYFNQYFGIPYPLEKLDHIAIPDFAAGAMENWGAITYRENAILVDQNDSSAATKQVVASIVAHEMAHMWFGDLVTMNWWNDLWLNESFASWMGDKAVDQLFPEWEMWTQFVSQDTNRALSLDGLQNSHPIEQEVKNPAEIGELFDAISYSKGGSIIRMLEHFVGEENFRQGLQNYISEYQYANAKTEQLWEALEKSSGMPISTIMDTWIKQTGYPLVEIKTHQSKDGIKVTATQNRFLYENLITENKYNDTIWQIPLSAENYSNVGNPTYTILDKRETSIMLPASSEKPVCDWVKINTGQTGFYRVNYSPSDWKKLRYAIENKLVTATDRLGIQNDAYALSKAGYIPSPQFLELVEGYTNETNASVWSDLAINLGSLRNLLANESYFQNFQDFGRRIFRSAKNQVGWIPKTNEGHLDALLRNTILTELGHYEDAETLTEASNLFTDYINSRNNIHPDIRGVIFKLAAISGNQSEYDTMWNLQTQTTLEEEKIRLLTALTYYHQPNLLQETLRRSLSPEVRTHNTITLVVGVAANPYGRDLAWEFMKSNWQEFQNRYGDGGFALMRLVSLTSSFSTPERLGDVKTFFESNPTPAAERTIQQSLEQIMLNIAWLEQNRLPLIKWFKKQTHNV